MAGHIRLRGEKRGVKSWEIKFETARDAQGRRKIAYRTVRGSQKDAQRALNAALAAVDAGIHQDPVKITVAEWLTQWLGRGQIRAKTAERYRQLIEQQIVPHLGDRGLDQLRPDEIADWHATLLRCGGYEGRPLAPRTVGHAHRVLRAALQNAAELEVLKRNVAALVRAPRVPKTEIPILRAAELAALLPRLAQDPRAAALYPIAALAVDSGLRRGEILGLAWRHLDIATGTIQVERTLTETAARTLTLEPPKTEAGRRRVAIPRETVAILLTHRRRLNEMRLAAGLGGVKEDDLIFADAAGTWPSPDNLSRDWRRLACALNLPEVSFHALRHTHASVLIRGGCDVKAVSVRLGHSDAAVTLKIYAHLFNADDEGAAAAIAAATHGRPAGSL